MQKKDMIISVRLNPGVKHLLVSLGVINKNGRSMKRCLNKMFNNAIKFYCIKNNLTDEYKLEQMLLIDKMDSLNTKSDELIKSKRLIAIQLAEIRDKVNPDMHEIIKGMEGLGYQISETLQPKHI